MTDRNVRQNADKASSEPAKELDEATLDQAAGAKHPAKVTVPDIKLGIGYREHEEW